ncbi:tetratricopeptide repeat protein [Xanthomonas sp. CFBP 8445]|uniref:tetratricopeptide repeat protein n=1 Tax=Xanthomonas sp. CFBP 8445 TaxID=2971236 RepID=UPI0021DF5B16|nr:tetratricopeptide repeat protein [Xanthomonas sp. CFBP 8445]UYC13199.1 tetratricopeptide repeat protein [Xanthomonas sp. CFBP 8445]
MRRRRGVCLGSARMSASSPNDRLAQAKALAMSAFQDAQRADALLAQAEALLRAVARAVPADADALTCLGAVLCDRGHYRRALTALRRAVRLQSHDRNTYFNLGVALLNAGREAEAMAAFRKAATLRAAPGSWAAYFDPHAHERCRACVARRCAYGNPASQSSSLPSLMSANSGVEK